MGFVVTVIILLLILSLISYLTRRKKPSARARISDISIEQLVQKESADGTNHIGQIDIDLGEISDVDWLDLDTHNIPRENFNAKVRWRNYGNRCDFKIVATAPDNGQLLTKTSDTYTTDCRT